MAKNVRENLRHESDASPTGALEVYGHRTARQSMYGCNNFETNCLGVVYRPRRQVNSFQYTVAGPPNVSRNFVLTEKITCFRSSCPMRSAWRSSGYCRRLEVRAELFSADGAGHGFFNAAPWYESTVSRMHGFLDRVLRPSR